MLCEGNTCHPALPVQHYPSLCPDQSGLERGGLHWVTMPWQDSLRARPGHPTRAVPLGNTDHGINTILPYARDSMTAWCALAASASGNS